MKDSEEASKIAAITKEAQNFNRIQYQNFLCSSLFILGKDFDACIVESDKGIKLCESFSYDPLKPETEKMH